MTSCWKIPWKVMWPAWPLASSSLEPSASLSCPWWRAAAWASKPPSPAPRHLLPSSCLLRRAAAWASEWLHAPRSWPLGSFGSSVSSPWHRRRVAASLYLYPLFYPLILLLSLEPHIGLFQIAHAFRSVDSLLMHALPLMVGMTHRAGQRRQAAPLFHWL